MLACLLIATISPLGARAEECTPGVEGCLPTPEQCSSGAHNGVTLGDETGRVAACVGADGHVIVYAGGQVLDPCGRLVVADQDVESDPNFDPNECPRVSDGLAGSTWHEEYFPSADGTELHADVYRPSGLAPDAQTPIILIVTPYANTGGTGLLIPGSFPPMPDVSPTGTPRGGYLSIETGSIVPEIFSRGYTLVVASMRSFGASAGCDDFGGAKAQADVKASVEWAASRPWSTGRVGMWGLSAAGWTQVMALATHPEGLAAVVIQSPVISRYAQSYTNGVPHSLTPLQNAIRFAYIGAIPPSLRSDPHQHQNWATGGAESLAGCDERNIAFSAINDPNDPFWIERDLTARAAGSTVPVLFSQGFLDPCGVCPSQFLGLWPTLQGPHRAWFGQYDHIWADSPDNPYIGLGPLGRGGFREEALRWLDTYVRQIPASETGVLDDPPVEVERSDGQWRTEQAWPPPDAQPDPIPLEPGTYLDVHGNSAEKANPVAHCSSVSVDAGNPCLRTANGQGTWTFTEPLASPLHIVGAPSLSVSVETLVPNANLIALVYDIDGDGLATLVHRGAFLLRAAGASTVTFDLYPQDWNVAAGHRIGILLTGSDDGWFQPISTFTPVVVQGGTLTLPVLPSPRASDLSGELSQAGRERDRFLV